MAGGPIVFGDYGYKVAVGLPSSIGREQAVVALFTLNLDAVSADAVARLDGAERAEFEKRKEGAKLVRAEELKAGESKMKARDPADRIARAKEERAAREMARKEGAVNSAADFAAIPGDTKAVYEALKLQHAGGRTIPKDVVEAALTDKDPTVRVRAVMYWYSFARESRNHAHVTALRPVVGLRQTDDDPSVRGWSMLSISAYYTTLGYQTFEKLDKALASDATFEGVHFDKGSAQFQKMKEKEIALRMVLQGCENAKRLKPAVADLAEKDPDAEIRSLAKQALEAIDKPVPKAAKNN